MKNIPLHFYFFIQLSPFKQNWQDQSCSPKIYARYTDDIFCSFKNLDKSLEFFDFINIQHRNLKFTMELSQKHSLPFLDVNVDPLENTSITKNLQKTHIHGLIFKFWFSVSYQLESQSGLGYVPLRLLSLLLLGTIPPRSCQDDSVVSQQWLPGRVPTQMHLEILGLKI